MKKISLFLFVVFYTIISPLWSVIGTDAHSVETLYKASPDLDAIYCVSTGLDAIYSVSTGADAIYCVSTGLDAIYSVSTGLDAIYSVSTGGVVRLNLKRIVRIDNEEIKVADLVDSYDGEFADYVKIKNVIVEVLPFEKRMINIPASTVNQKIKLTHPDVDVKISSTITAVRWEENILDTEKITNEAKVFLTKEYNLSDKAEFTFQNLPRITIPSENVKIAFDINRSTENSGMLRLVGKIFHDQREINIFNMLVKIQDIREIYQANRSIKKDEMIRASDFTVVTLKVNPMNTFLDELNYDKELIANRFISKGSYLKKTDIITTPDVLRNELVTVLIKAGNMELTYQAISRANGWLGDNIMLQNPDSKQTFQAKVIDKNKVIINLED